MAEEKKPLQGADHEHTPEGDETLIDEAGKGDLDDEMLPNRGEPVPQQDAGGNQLDTAGQHGEMAVEAARPVGDRLLQAEREALRRARENQ